MLHVLVLALAWGGGRFHSLAGRVIVSTRAQMSRLTVKSASTVFHVANGAPGCCGFPLVIGISLVFGLLRLNRELVVPCAPRTYVIDPGCGVV